MRNITEAARIDRVAKNKKKKKESLIKLRKKRSQDRRDKAK